MVRIKCLLLYEIEGHVLKINETDVKYANLDKFQCLYDVNGLIYTDYKVLAAASAATVSFP